MSQTMTKEAALIGIRQTLQEFFREAGRRQAPFFLLQYSGVKYVELEGQRPLRFANEAVKQAIPTIYAYLDRTGRLEATPVNSHLMVISSAVLTAFQTEIFGAPLAGTKIFSIHFPHPLCREYIPLARTAGWCIVYDCMDSWKEFYPLGQAHWFAERTEDFVCRNSDVIIATNPTLGGELRRFGAEAVAVVPNGVDPGRLDRKLPPLSLPRGEITVGFFGYITQAWFDWDRLVKLAKRRPRWLFPLIWWGEGLPPNLPPNIVSHGTVAHPDLPRYTAHWDVGLVNFKNTRLIHCSCPIKVYEYLHLGLPVVSVDIPHLREYPYVYTAVGVDDFERKIRTAVRNRPRRDVLDHFIREFTWSAQFDRYLAIISQHQAQQGAVR